MKSLIVSMLFAFSALGYAQPNLGVFSATSDVGSPQKAGQASYDPSTQTYTVQGAGYNIWFERDEFRYLYDRLKGDFILTAEVAFEGEGVDLHRKVGWMVRESADANAAHVTATLHGDGLTVLQWRELKGAFMRDPQDEIFSPKGHYSILQLERKGTEYLMRAAHPGEPLQLIGSHEMPHMGGEVLAGLFVCSHNPDVLETATIRNVRIDHPVPTTYNAYREGQIASRLETLELSTGHRNIIYEREKGFEAPNWHPDGKQLVVNMDGSMFRIPVSGGEPVKINTGFADRNNNDHVISFDGKQLAISHHQTGKPGGGSTIYVLPLAGGEPKQVTEFTPSYLHGWSPNNQEVVYVGQREGSDAYHIYRANIKTGEETQLTHFEDSHVDGPEYSPDGTYIYYNGTQSGTMQIWRMKPDGTEHEQMTFDQYNNWFPHLSPDGKWMVFISFLPEVPAEDHPFYQRVMLRLMPTSGGAPRVLTHLYGGQGSINVPSWSPDSKKIAFVSNKGSQEQKTENRE